MDKNWIAKINDLDQHLQNALEDFKDMKLLYQILKNTCGSRATEAFLEINKTFLKTYIRLSEKPLNDLKKIYVFQNRREDTFKLARDLGIDFSTIYVWLKEMGVARKGNKKNNDTINMFEKEK